jgi:hypothetical protein
LWNQTSAKLISLANTQVDTDSRVTQSSTR